MFAGIGGFRTGLTRAGGFRCVGHCEIDKYANASYEAIYEPGKEERYYHDATKIDPADLPDFDLLCGGFPCQTFSIAGRRKGFDDTRGTLFFEIARLAQSKRPSYLLLENVPGLLSHDKGRTFSVILATLNDLGYRVEWMVLNSKHFGVPQSRRRLFLICYLAVLLTRLLQFKVLKNNYCTEDLFDFIRDFRVAQISDRKYINLSRATPFIKEFTALCNLPLTSYFLSNGEIKKMLSHRF